MMGFIDKQLSSLSSKLSSKPFKSRRDSNGQTLLYFDGLHVIS